MAHPIIGQKSTRRKQWTLLSKIQLFTTANVFFVFCIGYDVLFEQTEHKTAIIISEVSWQKTDGQIHRLIWQNNY